MPTIAISTNKESHIPGIAIAIVILRLCIYQEPTFILTPILSILRYICFAFALYYLVKDQPKIGLFEGLLCVYGGIILCASLMHHATNYRPLISFAIDIVVLLTMMMSHGHKDPLYPIHAMVVAFSAAIYVNFILLLAYPNGLWFGRDGIKEYFFIGGNYNQFGRAMIPAVALQYFYYKQSQTSRFNLILLSIVCAVSIVIVGSKTSLVGLAILFGFMLIKGHHLRKIGLIGLIAVYIIFHLFVVFRNTEISNPYVIYFVEDVLHKDLTFTCRTFIWIKSMILAADSPLIGYGLQPEDWYMDNIDSIMPHNFILDMILKGGILLAICFFSIMLFIHRLCIKQNSEDLYFIFLTIWVILFMMIFEVYSFAIIIALCSIICYYHKEESSLANIIQTK